MHIREGEEVIRVVKRHLTPFVFKMLGVLTIAVPIFFVLFLIYKSAPTSDFVYIAFAILSFFFGIFIAVICLDYLLDKLIITNKRVVLVNWVSAFKKLESEAELRDIQDIDTHENGILARFGIFDYGSVEIETAATKLAILFIDCPNPDGVKHLILTQIECVKKPK